VRAAKGIVEGADDDIPSYEAFVARCIKDGTMSALVQAGAGLGRNTTRSMT
jgi:hypothetical protein